MFIEITDVCNTKPLREFININHIVAITEHPKGGCQIVMRDRSYYPHTQESYEEICKLINDKSRIR